MSTCDTDDRDAGEKHEQAPDVRFEYLSRTEQHIACYQVSKPPQYIDQRRRKPPARRVCKGTRETVTGNAMHKMRNRIGQKSASKKTCDIMIPFHTTPLFCFTSGSQVLKALCCPSRAISCRCVPLRAVACRYLREETISKRSSFLQMLSRDKFAPSIILPLSLQNC